MLMGFKTSKTYKVHLLLMIIGLGFLLQSCTLNDEEPKREVLSSELAEELVEPIKRDYAEIKKTGVLRMLTYYSSNTYFLHRGIQSGFEYEMVKEFAKENDLSLEVVIIGENQNPYLMLNRGEGDLIAANYTITPEREQIAEFTRPYNVTDQIVVVSEKLNFKPESISDMKSIPIAVRRNSSYYVKLMELKEEGFDLEIEIVPNDLDTEALLFLVANGTYLATVADENMYKAANTYMRGFVRGPVISRNDKIAWAIRTNSPDLESKMNKFLYKNFRFDENGLPKRSAFLNVLRKRYFEGSAKIADYFNPGYTSEQYSTISPYDSLIQSVASEFDLDWVMMTSIMAQESKFDQYSESWAGAVGLMQIIPRFSEIEADSLFIPEINIREGARILREHLDHYFYMDSTQQWQFALGTYNSGMGHIADARRLVIDQNKDPNEWEYVSEALLRLMQRKYYQNARYGFARGIETVRYVNEIMNRYKTYDAILALSRSQNQIYKGAIGLKTFN